MALFMDVHSLNDAVTMADVAAAHAADLATQDAHGVHYLRYWVDEAQGKDLLPRRRCQPGGSQHRPPRGPRTGR